MANFKEIIDSKILEINSTEEVSDRNSKIRELYGMLSRVSSVKRKKYKEYIAKVLKYNFDARQENNPKKPLKPLRQREKWSIFHKLESNLTVEPIKKYGYQWKNVTINLPSWYCWKCFISDEFFDQSEFLNSEFLQEKSKSWWDFAILLENVRSYMKHCGFDIDMVNGEPMDYLTTLKWSSKNLTCQAWKILIGSWFPEWYFWSKDTFLAKNGDKWVFLLNCESDYCNCEGYVWPKYAARIILDA